MSLPELKNKKAFVFDLDGTLVDLEKANIQGFKDVIKKSLNLDLSLPEYQEYFSGRGALNGFKAYLSGKKLEGNSAQDLTSEFHKLIRKTLKNNIEKTVKIKPGAEELLLKLERKGLKTALATSTIKEFTDLILEHFGIEEYFDLVITAEDIQKGKPDPEIYNLACEKLNVNKNEAIVFEDSKNGIKSAKDAGIFCIAILTKGLNDDFVHLADFTIKNYRQISNLL